MYLYCVEQLDHNCCYTSKESWSATTFHLLLEALDLDKGSPLLSDNLSDAGRIHVFDRRYKHRQLLSLVLL